MSDNTEEAQIQETEVEVAENATEKQAEVVVEVVQQDDAKADEEAPVQTEDEVLKTDSSQNGDAKADTNGKEEEIPSTADETEAAESSRKRKANDIGDATEATEEKRPVTDESENGGVHPDADMPLPDGAGDAETAAIKTKTVEEVQAGSAATA